MLQLTLPQAEEARVMEALEPRAGAGLGGPMIGARLLTTTNVACVNLAAVATFSRSRSNLEPERRPSSRDGLPGSP